MKRYIGYFKDDKDKGMIIIENREDSSMYPYEIVASDEIFTEGEIVIVMEITDIIEKLMKKCRLKDDPMVICAKCGKEVNDIRPQIDGVGICFDCATKQEVKGDLCLK